MGMGFCCCNQTCDICAEVGAGSGCSISQVAGTVTDSGDVWALTASNSIAMSSSSSGSVVEVRVDVDVISGDDGDEALIFIKSDATAANCHFAKLTFGATGSLKLYSRTAGVDTLLVTGTIYAPTFETLHLNLCYGQGVLSARETVYSSNVLKAMTTSETGRPYAGFGTGTISAEVDFSNFRYRFGSGASHTNCPTCLAGCDHGPGSFTTGLPGFTQVAGSWSFVGGIPSYAATTDTDAILRYDTVAAESGRLGLQFNAFLPALGDILKVYLNYTDADNCWIAEVTAGSRVRIILRSGGADTVVMDDAGALNVPSNDMNSVTHEFYYNQTTNRLTFNATGVLMHVLDVPPPTSLQVAIGTGGTLSGTLQVTYFNMTNCGDRDFCGACLESTGVADSGKFVTDDVSITLNNTGSDGTYTVSWYINDAQIGSFITGCYWRYDMGGGDYLWLRQYSQLGSNILRVFIGDESRVQTSLWEALYSVALPGQFDCLGGSYSLTNPPDPETASVAF